MHPQDAPTTPAAPAPRQQDSCAILERARTGPLDPDSAAYLVEGADAWRFVPMPAVTFALVVALGAALATADLIAASLAFLLALGFVPLVMTLGSRAAFCRRAAHLGLPEERARRLLRAFGRARARLVELDEKERLAKLREALEAEDRRA